MSSKNTKRIDRPACGHGLANDSTTGSCVVQYPGTSYGSCSACGAPMVRRTITQSDGRILTYWASAAKGNRKDRTPSEGQLDLFAGAAQADLFRDGAQDGEREAENTPAVAPSFRAQYGREPEPGRDYDPDGPMCQDDYEYLSGTGGYVTPDPAPTLPVPVYFTKGGGGVWHIAPMGADYSFCHYPWARRYTSSTSRPDPKRNQHGGICKTCERLGYGRYAVAAALAEVAK